MKYNERIREIREDYSLTQQKIADYLQEKGIGKNLSIDTEKWQSDYDAYASAFSNELKS